MLDSGAQKWEKTEEMSIDVGRCVDREVGACLYFMIVSIFPLNRK